jgi:hypothetical protein
MPRTLAVFQRCPPFGAGHPQIGQPPGEPADGYLGFEVPAEQLRDQRRPGGRKGAGTGDPGMIGYTLGIADY